MARAIVFDLDDTLYKERRFALSGFVAVAREVERRYDVPTRDAFAVLKQALSTGRRHKAFQTLCSRFGLPTEVMVELRSVFRSHVPNLRLPSESVRVLRALRPAWRLGILTNGFPATQSNKIAALSVASEVDAVVLARETGADKPHPAAFEAVLGRLDVDAAHAVFVGDDPWCDIFGARRAGMKTIRVRRGVDGSASPSFLNDADATVTRLSEVPAHALALVPNDSFEKVEGHAA